MNARARTNASRGAGRDVSKCVLGCAGLLQGGEGGLSLSQQAAQPGSHLLGACADFVRVAARSVSRYCEQSQK